MSEGLIVAVAPGSVAERAGVRAGDVLLAVNGYRVRDAVDVGFYAAEESLRLEVRREGKGCTLSVERRYGEPLGLSFADASFDGIRRCENRCEFCFVSQMPLGLRHSLYVRDDDYRHSFLFGSYITLTGMEEEDWVRIAEQHLSPLYVSVHATELELRRGMLGNPLAPDVLAQLRRLAGLGIEVHTQIVVVPEVNDRLHLQRSIDDLVDLYPAVRSVSVVPVGVTKYHRGRCRVPTRDEAQAVVDLVTERQEQLGQELGAGFVYLSDEWYLGLGLPVPEAAHYGELDLTENGIGLVRRFLDEEAPRLATLVPGLAGGRRVTLVTGELFAPILQRVTAGMEGAAVVPVTNTFFGRTVTVAGLLTAQDIVNRLQDESLGDVVLLPRAMFGGPEGQSLDDLTPAQVGEALGQPVQLV